MSKKNQNPKLNFVFETEEGRTSVVLHVKNVDDIKLFRLKCPECGCVYNLADRNYKKTHFFKNCDRDKFFDCESCGSMIRFMPNVQQYYEKGKVAVLGYVPSGYLHSLLYTQGKTFCEIEYPRSKTIGFDAIDEFWR